MLLLVTDWVACLRIVTQAAEAEATAAAAKRLATRLRQLERELADMRLREAAAAEAAVQLAVARAAAEYVQSIFLSETCNNDALVNN